MRYVLAFVLLSTGAFAECPAPIPAQRDIIADSYYDDPPVYSHIDPVKHAAYEAAVKPLDNYLRTVAKLASEGQKTCAVRWLVSWSEGDAMLGRIEKEQAHYERKWILSGLALSYAKVRDAASNDQRAAIDTWLQAVADGVRSHSDAFKGVRNNHYYWEGLAVAATGAVTGNAKDVAWGHKVFNDAMADIAPDGTLPPEMRRGGRALHYHLFSAAPLAMLESILDLNDPKFVKLADFCRAAVANTDLAAKQAGVPQIGILDDDSDWVAVYLRRHPSALPLKETRIPYVDRLGGDVSSANPLEHPVK
ncbi:MAG: alginate lyase family protein [Rhizomicrobium sp.]|nr:alginate lyase family protein [Rhizomicrobium sp.]